MVKASFPLKMSRLVMKGRSTGKGGSLIRLELEGLIDKVNVAASSKLPSSVSRYVSNESLFKTPLKRGREKFTLSKLNVYN